VASAHSPWARRRKVDLAELVDEPWILSPPKGWSYELVAEAFKSRGLRVPSPALMTNTMELRTRLLANGPYITVVPTSALNGEAHGLKVLPIALPARAWPITIFTLKNRSLSPVAERFIACAREVAKGMAQGKS
jgi:DNA-binding transcriptional LysR family regulator